MSGFLIFRAQIARKVVELRNAFTVFASPGHFNSGGSLIPKKQLATRSMG